MPLFFMISGFFTAMLWRKRGLGGLVEQRLKRIALPLLIGCLTIVPLMWIVNFVVSQPSTADSSPAAVSAAEVWAAVNSGDTPRVRKAIEDSEIDINALNPDYGASMLASAAFQGHSDLVNMLLESGADVNVRNRDQATALHTAAFMGRPKIARNLLAAGADPDAVDANGQTPKTLLKLDFGTTNFIAASLGVPLDKDDLFEGRAEIAKQFGVTDHIGSAGNSESGLAALFGPLYGLLFQFPLFMHLWFLAFLCWLVALFVVYAPIANLCGITKLPKWLICSPASLLWLVPLTMLPQAYMTPGVFGPDTSIGLLPLPKVLGYYAIFFFFGAVYWDIDDREESLGRLWYVSLPVALLVLFPIGMELISGSQNLLPKLDASTSTLASNFVQAAFVWLMVFGSIGICRRFLSSESKVMRYISDSSYWLYLAHLPLVVLAQWAVRDIQLPSLIKFIGVNLVVTVILLLSYEYCVRYTPIGTMLNGPRTRTKS